MMQEQSDSIATQLPDPASSAAYVVKQGGAPDTTAYMWAGYGVAFALYLGYVLLLLKRISQAKKRGDAMRDRK